jgi:hypothetical protein
LDRRVETVVGVGDVIKFVTDPLFIEKVRDIVGLYLDPDKDG